MVQKINFGPAAAAALGTAATAATGTPYAAPPYKPGGIAMASPVKSIPTEASTQIGVSEALLNARLETVEARTDTKFERLIGKIDGLTTAIGGVSTSVGELGRKMSEIDTKTTNTRTIVITTILGAFLATVGILYTVAAFGVQIAQFMRGY